MIAEKLVETIRVLPRDERRMVILSILKSAGPGIEQDVRELDEELQSMGVDPKESLIEALHRTIHGPDGPRIIRIVASAAAQEVTVKRKQPKEAARVRADKYESILKKAEGTDDDGMGVVATIVAAAAAVLTAAVRLIGGAVRKMKRRRRKLKRRLTPLKEEDRLNIARAIAPRLASVSTRQAWQIAQEAIKPMIAELRAGRTKYLLDPAKGANKGSKVNEYRDMLQTFMQVHQPLRQQYLASKLKKKLIAGGVVAISAVTAIGATAYLTGD